MGDKELRDTPSVACYFYICTSVSIISNYFCSYMEHVECYTGLLTRMPLAMASTIPHQEAVSSRLRFIEMNEAPHLVLISKFKFFTVTSF